MNWLVLSYFLSIGTLSYTGQITDTNGFAVFNAPQSSFQTTLGVEAQAFDNHVFLANSVETWESTSPGGGFSPFEAFYVFSVGMRGWGFEVGYRHECDHPVAYIFGQTFFEGISVNKDELYLSFTGKLNVF